MSNNSRSPSRSDTGLSRALKVGAAFGLTYLLLTLILSLLPRGTFLDWLWLFVSGPGVLVVAVLQFRPTSLVWPILFGTAALFYFAVGATTATATKFRWLILTIWAIIAIASAILGFYVIAIMLDYCACG